MSETLNAIAQLCAQAAERQGQQEFREAERLYLEALQLARQGRLREARATIHFNLGSLYFIQQRVSDARREYKLAAKAQPDWAHCQFWLAQAYFQERRYKSAEKTFEELLKRTDLDSSVRAEHLFQAGHFFYFVGNYERAEPLLREALSLHPEHSAVRAGIWEQLGLLYEQSGQQGQALECYQKCLATSGDQPMLHARALARVARHQPPDEALENFTRMYAILQNEGQAESLECMWLVQGYASVLGSLGRHEEAAALTMPDPFETYRMMLESQVASSQGTSLETADALLSLASTNAYDGHTAEAERLYREALAMKEEMLGENDPALCEILCDLARVLDGDEGLAHLNRALAILASHPGKLAERARALETLARLEHPEQAAAHFREALELLERLHGPRHSDTLECRWRLGRFFLQIGAPAESLPILQRLAELSDRNRAIHKLERADFLSSYAVALEHCGQAEEAQRMHAESQTLLKQGMA